MRVFNPVVHFWSRVDKTTSPTGCWPWAGGKGHGGQKLKYGATWYKGRTWGAHQVAWMITHGPIPDGMLVLHHCDNPPCCKTFKNVDGSIGGCLFLGTHADNAADKVAKNRLLPSYTPAVRQKMRLAKLGKKASAATKLKMSASQRARLDRHG